MKYEEFIKVLIKSAFKQENQEVEMLKLNQLPRSKWFGILKLHKSLEKSSLEKSELDRD